MLQPLKIDKKKDLLNSSQLRSDSLKLIVIKITLNVQQAENQ